MLDATKKNTTLGGKVYGLPHIWGTDGLVVNTKLAKMTDYHDLCKAEYKGKTSVRLKRPTLLAFAFASGKDPFALYGDPKAYAALMDDVGKKLAACKANIKFFWDNKDQLLNGVRTGEIVGAMMWDTGGWKLNAENPDIKYIAPKSGALGWIDTFALPAKGRNDAAAYAWINFNMRPEIAAKVAASAGNFTASKGADQLMDAKLKAQFAKSFPEAALKNIKWYPAVPPGIEEIEGKVLDRVKAAKLIRAARRRHCHQRACASRRAARISSRSDGHAATISRSTASPSATARTTAVDDVSCQRRARQLLLDPRAVRLRQDDAAAHDRRLPGAGRRRHPHRRPLDARRAAQPAPGQHGVPAPRAVPDDERRRERRLWPRAPRRRARRDRRSASARC